MSFRSLVQGGLAVSLVMLAMGSGCEFDLEAGAPNHIDHTRVLGMRVTVAELAPIWPERVGVHPDEAPIVEALPGDRVRLEAILIGGDGRALPPEDHDAIWFQCDATVCAGDLPRCEDLEWTSESACELGRGGVFEFLAPPPGRGSRATSATWASLPTTIRATRRRADRVAARDHGTVEVHDPHSEAPLGPRWAMLHDAAMAGFDIGMPLYEIHWSAFLQPANRAPAPEPPTFADAATGEPLEGSPPRVRGGQQIRTEGLNWRPADRQPYVVAEEVVEFESYVFVPEIEGFDVAWFTAGPLRTIARKGDVVVLEVEEFADPGLIRAIIVFGDNRRAADFRVLELEVVP